MSRVKTKEEIRRDDIEERVMRFLIGEITSDEMSEIFDDARRYRALYRFVDDTDLGSIVADGVYADLSDEDAAPPPPEHCLNTDEDESGSTGISAEYGVALDSLADFLDANRNAGKTSALRELSAGLLRATGRSPDA
jgi:hypothetical protein